MFLKNIFNKYRFPLRYFCSTKYYYATKIPFWDIFLPVKYIQFLGEYKYGKLMKTIPYFTKHINLLQTDQELKSSFSKQTRYKINRAVREDIKFNIYKLDTKEKIDNYINYYNNFLKSKGLLFRISKREFYALLKNYVVTYASYNDEILVMHCSFVDYKLKTVYIHHSASHFRTLKKSKSNIDKNFISYANCFLHYQDMLYFKNLGMKTYDFGGYGVNTDDKSILSINQFKDGFRGKLVQQNHYISYPFLLISLCYQMLKPCVIKQRIIKIEHLLNYIFQSKAPYFNYLSLLHFIVGIEERLNSSKKSPKAKG